MTTVLQFDKSGYLTPYDAIGTDLQTLERVFVEEFSTSVTRRRLFDAYRQYTSQIQDTLPAGVVFVQWIDGSFVTQKRDPNDIDVVTFVDFRLYEQYEPFFDSLRELPYLRKTDVDGYYVRVYPVDHPNYRLYNLDRADWNFRFNTPKPKGNKGFLELTY